MAGVLSTVRLPLHLISGWLVLPTGVAPASSVGSTHSHGPATQARMEVWVHEDDAAFHVPASSPQVACVSGQPAVPSPGWTQC
ncbi:hypothetical protein HaLaN_27393 [Haematococcus lacustris]|uniref:Secreted protein n=1 Tax=Haematococcus lacustris TaxID=44745 RepID=A0A6A0A827_HAELA|nr:hypothetical protein HaLaN_27393 [Haematococcus lacustris]